jgi:hypothetical protein
MSRLYYGCFDGTRGQEIAMTLEQAQTASHQGQCDERENWQEMDAREEEA